MAHSVSTPEPIKLRWHGSNLTHWSQDSAMDEIRFKATWKEKTVGIVDRICEVDKKINEISRRASELTSALIGDCQRKRIMMYGDNGGHITTSVSDILHAIIEHLGVEPVDTMQGLELRKKKAKK